MCTTAAPAFAAARHSPAICSGVTGTYGLAWVDGAPPVTAQVMMTGLAIAPTPRRVADRHASQAVHANHAVRPLKLPAAKFIVAGNIGGIARRDIHENRGGAIMMLHRLALAGVVVLQVSAAQPQGADRYPS